MGKKNLLVFIICMGLVLFSAVSHAKITTIRFATEIYPPFTTLDDNKQLQGFDIDIAQALCEKIKTQCTFSTDQFENMVPSLKAKKYDAWISAITIIDKHKKDASLTNPYFSSTAQLIATQDTVFNAAPVEIKNKTIGVGKYGHYLRFLRKTYGNIINLKIFATRNEAFDALSNGSVDAVIDDAMVLKNWRLSQNNYKKYRLIDLPAKYSSLVRHKYGIAVAKNNIELLKALNDAIIQIKADGAQDKLIKKYFVK